MHSTLLINLLHRQKKSKNGNLYIKFPTKVVQFTINGAEKTAKRPTHYTRDRNMLKN